MGLLRVFDCDDEEWISLDEASGTGEWRRKGGQKRPPTRTRQGEEVQWRIGRVLGHLFADSGFFQPAIEGRPDARVPILPSSSAGIFGVFLGDGVRATNIPS